MVIHPKRFIMANVKAKNFYDKYSGNESFKKRKQSSIYHLRQRNNILKSLIIESLVDKYMVNKVLDVGCGRGGDMYKYYNSGVQSLVGIDFSYKRIQSAIDRLKTLKQTPKHYEFQVHDMNVPFLSTKAPFDMVSFVFCIHYAEKLADTVITYSNQLRPGGCMMIIYMDFDIVRKSRFEKNSICEIRDLGNDEISFTLAENVENCTEKKMTFALFQKSIPTNLKIVHDMNFEDCFKCFDGNKILQSRFMNNNRFITNDELTVSNFYRVLVLVKQDN